MENIKEVRVRYAPSPTGLQHIGMPTNDIERTIRFYEALGFEVAFRTDNKGEEVASKPRAS